MQYLLHSNLKRVPKLLWISIFLCLFVSCICYILHFSTHLSYISLSGINSNIRWIMIIFILWQPVIPVFTQNVRESFRTLKMGRSKFREYNSRFPYDLFFAKFEN